MSQRNKTQPTDLKPTDYIGALKNQTRRRDAETLLTIFSALTQWEPRMWGPSIIGFGRYHYTYDTGREGDMLATGFAPRAASLSIYIMPGYGDFADELSRLGKHKVGKSCLYVNKLADIDLDVLKEIISGGLERLKKIYPVFPQ